MFVTSGHSTQARQEAVREIKVPPEAPPQASADISLTRILLLDCPWLPWRQEGGMWFSCLNRRDSKGGGCLVGGPPKCLTCLVLGTLTWGRYRACEKQCWTGSQWMLTLVTTPPSPVGGRQWYLRQICFSWAHIQNPAEFWAPGSHYQLAEEIKNNLSP